MITDFEIEEIEQELQKMDTQLSNLLAKIEKMKKRLEEKKLAKSSCDF